MKEFAFEIIELEKKFQVTEFHIEGGAGVDGMGPAHGGYSGFSGSDDGSTNGSNNTSGDSGSTSGNFGSSFGGFGSSCGIQSEAIGALMGNDPPGIDPAEQTPAEKELNPNKPNFAPGGFKSIEDFSRALSSTGGPPPGVKAQEVTPQQSEALKDTLTNLFDNASNFFPGPNTTFMHDLTQNILDDRNPFKPDKDAEN